MVTVLGDSTHDSLTSKKREAVLEEIPAIVGSLHRSCSWPCATGLAIAPDIEVGVVVANGVLHSDDHLLGSGLWVRLRSGCSATTLIVLADNLVATIKDADVDVVIDGKVEVAAFPLHTTTVVVGDEVHVQTSSTLAQVEVGVLQSIDGLCTRRSHARPSTKQVVGIAKAVAPGIECQFCLAGLVEYEEGIAVVLDAGFQLYLLHSIGGEAQIDIVVECEVEVWQL